MAKTVAELIVNLSANTARFQRDMRAASSQSQAIGRQIRGHVGEMRRSFDNLTAGVKGFAAAYIGLRGVQALVSATRDAVEFGAAINDAALRIGITTDSLQELRFAAEQSGGTVAGLDTAMEQFVRRVGEARAGTGALGDVLEQYSISVTGADGQTRSVDAILRDLADTIANTSDATEQARIGNAAFGRGWREIIGALREGSRGMDEAADAAHELGVVMDAEVIAAAAEADDRLAQLSTTLDVQLKTVLISLAPIIETVGGWLVWLGQQAAAAVSAIEEATDVAAMAAMTAGRLPVNLEIPIAGMGEEARQEQLAMIDRAMAEVMADIAGVQAQIEAGMSATMRGRIEGELADLTARQNELAAGRADFLRTLEEFDAPAAETPIDRGPVHLVEPWASAMAGASRNELQQMAAELDQAIADQITDATGGGRGSASTEALQAGIANLEATAAAVDRMISAFPAGGGGGGGRAAANDNALAAILEVDREALDRFNDSMSAATDLIREHQTPLQAYTARVTELRGLMTALTAAGLSAAEAQAIINAEIAEAAVVMNDAGEAAAEANQMWTDFGNVATNAFAAATAEGANFRDVLLGIINDLLQMASVQKWIASLFEGEGGGIGDIFSTLFGGGGVGTQSMGFLNFERAEGGPVAPGLTYLVGEQGPELFTSSRGGQIIPNDALGGGGVTIVQNNDFRSAETGMKQWIEMRLAQSSRQTVATAMALMDRGGRESKISGRRPA